MKNNPFRSNAISKSTDRQSGRAVSLTPPHSNKEEGEHKTRREGSRMERSL